MNGVVILDKVQAKSLEASSVNGSIIFLGPMLKDGSYSLSDPQRHGDRGPAGATRRERERRDLQRRASRPASR